MSVRASLTSQVAGLAGAVALLLVALSLAPLIIFRDETSYLTASGGWSPMLVSVILGAAAYAITVVHGRVLAMSSSSATARVDG